MSGTEIATVKKELVEGVEKRIQALVDKEQLHLPPNYSAANALQAAGLALQEARTKDKKPVLQACSRTSIANALFSMVVQGLDVGKKQGYFIAYGQTLTFQRSYFGTLAVAKRMAGVRDAYAEIIFQGDTFEYEISHGRKVITRHVQKLENVDTSKMRGAYAVVTFTDPERPETVEIMTWPQIEKAWSKGQGDNPARRDFPDQMALRTVLNRALKLHINSSDDNHLGLEAFNQEPDEAVEASVEQEARELGNGEIIDVDAVEAEDEPVEGIDGAVDMDTGEIIEEEPRAVEQPTVPF